MYIFISPQPPDIAFGPGFEGPTTIALQQQAAHIGSNHRSLSRLLAIKGKGLVLVNYRISTITLQDIDPAIF